MKIEKLTENKIRVIVNHDDLTKNNIDSHSLMNKELNTQNLFLEILEKAEEELGFYTDGHKLLIEAFSSTDEAIVFTITKYQSKEFPLNNDSLDMPKKKKINVRRKTLNFTNKHIIYAFNSFDEFCNFCTCINQIRNFEIDRFSKNITLFFYRNTYYLVIKNINIKYRMVNSFYSIASEFGKLLSLPKSFENKLFEYGKIIIKGNAIDVGIKYFV